MCSINPIPEQEYSIWKTEFPFDWMDTVFVLQSNRHNLFQMFCYKEQNIPEYCIFLFWNRVNQRHPKVVKMFIMGNEMCNLGFLCHTVPVILTTVTLSGNAKKVCFSSQCYFCNCYYNPKLGNT